MYPIEVMFVMGSYLIKIYAGGHDPCQSSVDLPDLKKRQPSYPMDNIPLCDRNIDTRWYRAINSKMPEKAPPILSCGTLYPYWMSGKLPTNKEMASVKVCKVAFSGQCVAHHNIRVKDCGNYHVYELTPLSSCISAYCFELFSSCVKESPKGVSVAIHNITWTKPISKNLALKKHAILQFKCNFQPMTESNLFYDVTWYGNKKEIKDQTVEEGEMAILTSQEMKSSNIMLNSFIHCLVGAKRIRGDTACIMSTSPLFFAGIKVQTPIVNIERGKSADVVLQMTVPFVDEKIGYSTPRQTYLRWEGTKLYVDVLDPQSISADCSGGAVTAPCSINIPGIKTLDEDWKRNHSLTIHNKDSDNYEIKTHVTLRLQTKGPSEGPNTIYAGVHLPEIQVFISESNAVWKSKTCGSKTDPHMHTFDGIYYQCHLSGTFVLYRNAAYNQEVQTRHRLCDKSITWNPKPYCNCAAAVRSGRDIFTIDMCNNVKIINFPLCDDNVLKVTKINDRLYKIFMPTGTTVQIRIVSLWGWLLNVDIYPSLIDVGNTTGLCGVLDGNPDNDFRRRNGVTDDIPLGYPKYPNAFSKSWRVEATENILDESTSVYSDLESISTTYGRLCSCKRNKERNLETICNYIRSTPCTFQREKLYQCILHPGTARRKKRDLEYMRRRNLQENDIQIPEIYSKRFKRQTTMTQEEAEHVCRTAFEQSEAYRTCEQHVSDMTNTSLFNCIADTMMTGDENIIQVHIDGALQQCTTFVALNKTLQREEPDVTYQIQTLCPSNCSGHGACFEGNCTCNTGYAGSDCSFDLLGPPTITHISGFGLCDGTNEECNDITVYGQYFLENMNTSCYFTRYKISLDESVSSEEYDTVLEERTLFEGYCPLIYDLVDIWVTGFTFNISNDGIRYTNNFQFYTYQSLCQEYHNASGKVTFSLKDGYCFISNLCIPDGKVRTTDSCEMCNVSNSIYNWSNNSACITTMEPSTMPTEAPTTSAPPITKQPLTTTTEPPITSSNKPQTTRKEFRTTKRTQSLTTAKPLRTNTLSTESPTTTTTFPTSTIDRSTTSTEPLTTATTSPKTTETKHTTTITKSAKRQPQSPTITRTEPSTTVFLKATTMEPLKTTKFSRRTAEPPVTREFFTTTTPLTEPPSTTESLTITKYLKSTSESLKPPTTKIEPPKKTTMESPITKEFLEPPTSTTKSTNTRTKSLRTTESPKSTTMQTSITTEILTTTECLISKTEPWKTTKEPSTTTDVSTTTITEPQSTTATAPSTTTTGTIATSITTAFLSATKTISSSNDATTQSATSVPTLVIAILSSLLFVLVGFVIVGLIASRFKSRGNYIVKDEEKTESRMQTLQLIFAADKKVENSNSV